MSSYDKTLMTLVNTLIHAGRAYKGAADALTADFELSHASAWPVLMISRLGDGVRPGVVADAVGIEPPSLVRIIDQLVAAELVLRKDDPSDRRAKTLSLTAEGKRVAERLEKALAPFRRELFKDIPQADVEATVRVLLRLDQVLAERNAS
ncbi:MarR family winged helix-turn-helix transcriptional regulator [Duganella radicis]|uniref:MarR family transcriptional regulator n=1 Tax=Duganella radicis TaxID=551988 RepID=A0A6L6PF19_9BURK|nr:MarR family winged helix-turn-helix transcriptional regulator [Duganella radicis]MTV37668.1 MarR family transcriptional regulator [Duganella radicis]